MFFVAFMFLGSTDFKYDHHDYMQKYHESEKIQAFCKAELKYRPSGGIRGVFGRTASRVYRRLVA